MLHKTKRKTRPPKFSKREQAKLKQVLDSLRARLLKNLIASGSRFDNDLGCGNCGDTGPFHGTLYEVEVLVGLRKAPEPEVVEEDVDEVLLPVN